MTAPVCPTCGPDASIDCGPPDATGSFDWRCAGCDVARRRIEIEGVDFDALERALAAPAVAVESNLEPAAATVERVTKPSCPCCGSADKVTSASCSVPSCRHWSCGACRSSFYPREESAA